MASLDAILPQRECTYPVVLHPDLPQTPPRTLEGSDERLSPQAYKIIAFGTDTLSQLGYHFGILFALIGVEIIGFTLSQIFERWKLDRGKLRAKRAKEREKQAEVNA